MRRPIPLIPLVGLALVVMSCVGPGPSCAGPDPGPAPSVDQVARAAVIEATASGAGPGAIERVGGGGNGPGRSSIMARRQHHVDPGTDSVLVLTELIRQATKAGNRWLRVSCSPDLVSVSGAQVVEGFTVDTDLELVGTARTITASARSGAQYGHGVIATEPLTFLTDCGPEIGPKISEATTP